MTTYVCDILYMGNCVDICLCLYLYKCQTKLKKGIGLNIKSSICDDGDVVKCLI